MEYQNSIFEIVSYQENMRFRMNDMTIQEFFPAHWHTAIEIIRVSENWYQIRSNDKIFRLEEGDIGVIRPGVIHELTSPVEGNRTVYLADMEVWTGLSSLETLLALLPPVTVISKRQGDKIYEEAGRLLSEIRKAYQDKESFYELEIFGKLTELLRVLGLYHLSSASFDNIHVSGTVKYRDRLLAVCEYINEHYMENLTLDEVSSLAGFSKYHFARIFKSFAHISFYKYLNQKRITQAEQMLSNPDYPVTEIALQCGFSSLSAFIRMFKQIKGCTPTQFRHMYSLDCMNRIEK